MYTETRGGELAVNRNNTSIIICIALLATIMLLSVSCSGSDSGVTFTYENFVSLSSDNSDTEVFIIPSKLNGKDVTTIGESAFECCQYKTIVIPSTVKTIEDEAFVGCASLVSISIPEGVSSIGSNSFCDCERLITISLPSSLREIGNNAFYGCTNLKSVDLRDGIRTIGDAAFADCFKLSDITIPVSVTHIGERSFENCYALSRAGIKYLGTIEMWKQVADEMNGDGLYCDISCSDGRYKDII